MAKGSVIQDLIFNIGASTAELTRGVRQANNTISSLTSSATKLTGALGIAFGAKEILSFIGDVSRLAGEADGVKASFDKIDGSVKLLNDLKVATRGTVSELALMKNAIQFKNFNLDLAQLPKLLEFATKRAAETGQSVDYLVQSMVTGLGRKSVLILDNLGLSATQLNSEVAKTGDFFKAVGVVVDDQLKKMGTTMDTNLTRSQRLAASWENYKIAVGRAANETGILGGAIDALSGSLDVASSQNLTGWQKLVAFLGGPVSLAAAAAENIAKETERVNRESARQEFIVKQVDKAFKQYNGDLDEFIKHIAPNHVNKTLLIAEFTKRLNDQTKKKNDLIENEANLTTKLNALQADSLLAVGASRLKINQEIEAIQAKIKALQELGKVEDPKEVLKSLDRISKFQFRKPDTAPIATTVPFDTNKVDDIIQPIDLVTPKITYATDLLTKFGITAEQAGEMGASAFMTFGTALGSMISGQKGAFASFVSAMLDGLRSIVQALLATAIAKLIAGEAVKGLPGIIAAAVGVSILTALWKRSVPGFALGGNHSGGLMRVGEAGEEIVATGKARVWNNRQTKDFLSSGGSGNRRLEAFVTGEQIRFVLDETDRRRGI